jgi:hypothetical protein
VNIYHSFKHKYHEHEYKNCRLIKVNECLRIEDIWTPIITNHALDLLCCNPLFRAIRVPDKFIMDYCNDGTITNNIMFLKITQEMIIDTFIREYIQLPTESDNDSHPDPSLCNTVCVSGSPPNELNRSNSSTDPPPKVFAQKNQTQNRRRWRISGRRRNHGVER